MRFLYLNRDGEFALTKDLATAPGRYAILSHTWGQDDDEVTFEDLNNQPESQRKTSWLGWFARTAPIGDSTREEKIGYKKLWFCIEQARRDGLKYCWIDTCCINKANNNELSEAITSMFRWYQEAAKCYVYLADVTATEQDTGLSLTWEQAFLDSRWFRRGWTLQELLAPACVEFFSAEGRLLGTKQTLEGLIHRVTNIPTAALRGTDLLTFTIDERFRWAQNRQTKKIEDEAYCLLGIFGIFMPLNYGEGRHAAVRLREEVQRRAGESNHTSRLGRV
jgi:hypothetical protein